MTNEITVFMDQKAARTALEVLAAEVGSGQHGANLPNLLRACAAFKVALGERDIAPVVKDPELRRMWLELYKPDGDTGVVIDHRGPGAE